MAAVHGKSTTVYLGQYDLTGYCDSADIGQMLEPAETTTFGNNSKTYIAGLRDGTIALSGNADYAAGAVDAVLNAATDGSQKYVTIGMGTEAVGSRCKLATIRQTQYGQSIPVGDKVTWSADMQADGGIDGNGVILHIKEAETGTENGASVDNSAASTNGYAALLHVFTADTLTGVTIKVQHSTDNASWSDLCTFTSVADVTSEIKTGTGTVNRYVRYIISAFTGTSLTFVVSFARR